MWDIEQLVAEIRTAAQQEILSRFNRVTAQRKADGSLLNAADTGMQSVLTKRLKQVAPEIPMLGEEMSPDEQAAILAEGGDLWCLDPLDGTNNFAAGIPFFSVSLALIRQGKAVLGIVYDPSTDEAFYAETGQGVWLNGQALQSLSEPERLKDCMAIIDFKRLPGALSQAIAQKPPYRSQRSFGSVALDWCWMAAGRCHLYLHGGQKLWDYAAGQVILAESKAAGGVLEAYDGAWCEQAALKPRIAVAAANAALLAQWKAYLVDSISSNQ